MHHLLQAIGEAEQLPFPPVPICLASEEVWAGVTALVYTSAELNFKCEY